MRHRGRYRAVPANTVADGSGIEHIARILLPVIPIGEASFLGILYGKLAGANRFLVRSIQAILKELYLAQLI